MKRIVQGNDFRMRIPVFRIYNGEQVPFALPASERIQVRLCGEYRRIDLEYEIDVANDNVLVAKVDGRNISCGCYALEVRGVMFGQDWRSCEYEQIRIVHNNAEADTEFDYSDGEPSVEMDTALVILAADPDFYTKVEQAEQARAAAESQRVSAEEARVLAEKERITNDSARQTAEDSRVTAEAERVKEETKRISAEEARMLAEENRVTAENSRDASEQLRNQAEQQRVSAESARGLHEQERITNENARISAESERVENENTRKANETNRIAAEEIRITAEQNREIAEAQREANEEKRQEFFASVSKDMFVPVAQLPTEDIDPKTIYLLKDSSGKDGNLYQEFIYTNGAWEMIGSASVDIKGVLREEDIATVNGQKLTNGGNILLSAETIVLDAEPTEGSVNGVTSGGVVDYMKPIYGEEIDINSMLVVAEKGYKWLRGVKTADSSFSIYEPISLKKGDIIKWDCPKYGVYNGMDFMGYMDGETHVPLVTLTSDLSSQYILQNDHDVIFCLRQSIMMTIKVARNGKYDEEELAERHYFPLQFNGYPYLYGVTVGSTWNWGLDTSKITRSTCVKVQAGERYVMELVTHNNPIAMIIDENNVVVSLMPNTLASKEYEIIIPEGGAWLFYCFNQQNGEGTFYKKTNVQSDEMPADYDRIVFMPGKATLKKDVGGICTFELDSSWGNGYFVILVSEGDEYLVSVSQVREPCYMILNSSRVVIVSDVFEHPTMTANCKITIPAGGMFLVINYRAEITPVIKKTKDGRTGILEYNAHKEGFLANMSRHITDDAKEPSAWTKRLCMAWTSDTHLDINQYERFAQYAEANKAYIDAVLHTGDANRMADTDKGFEKTVMAYKPTIPMIFTLGNHDTYGQSQNGDALSSGTLEWNGEHYTKPFLDENCAATSDNCTYYRDFPSQKIRVISINDYGITRYADGAYWVTTTDETEISKAVEWDADTSYAVDDIVLYKGLYLKCKTAGRLPDDAHTWPARTVPVNKYDMNGRYLPQEYIDFILAALNVEAGWSIILTAHQPFEKYTNQEIANEAWQTAPQSFNIPSAAFSQNGYILQDILSAYIKRTAIEKTYSAVNTTDNPLAGKPINDAELLPDVTVAADFTLAKGSVIAFLHGHAHTDSCFYSSHMDDGIKLLCIGINTGCFCPNDLYNRFYSGDIAKGEDGTRDLFNIISFDTESKEIFLLRIGADVTENFTERKFARIKYTT